MRTVLFGLLSQLIVISQRRNVTQYNIGFIVLRGFLRIYNRIIKCRYTFIWKVIYHLSVLITVWILHANSIIAI